MDGREEGRDRWVPWVDRGREEERDICRDVAVKKFWDI